MSQTKKTKSKKANKLPAKPALKHNLVLSSANSKWCFCEAFYDEDGNFLRFDHYINKMHGVFGDLDITADTCDNISRSRSMNSCNIRIYCPGCRSFS